MNFEQFCEEARAAFPAAAHICATEHPLAVWVDGQPADLRSLVAAHRACWLSLDKSLILADGLDTGRLNVRCPSLAESDFVLILRHGMTELMESIRLDARGEGEIEITSQTPGRIVITARDLPVRVELQVEEIDG
jgi:hypothetical protein